MIEWFDRVPGGGEMSIKQLEEQPEAILICDTSSPDWVRLPASHLLCPNRQMQVTERVHAPCPVCKKQATRMYLETDEHGRHRVTECPHCVQFYFQVAPDA